MYPVVLAARSAASASGGGQSERTFGNNGATFTGEILNPPIPLKIDTNSILYGSRNLGGQVACTLQLRGRGHPDVDRWYPSTRMLTRLRSLDVPRSSMSTKLKTYWAFGQPLAALAA